MRRALLVLALLAAAIAIAGILLAPRPGPVLTPGLEPEPEAPRAGPVPHVASVAPTTTGEPEEPAPAPTAGPVAPEAPSPTFLAWFRLAYEGPRAPEGLRWSATGGRFQASGALLPAQARVGDATPAAPPEPGLHGPVEVPSTLGEVSFEVRAEGWSPWSIEDALPRTSAFRVYEVGLRPAPAGRVLLEVHTSAGALLALGPHGLLARLERAEDGRKVAATARQEGERVVFDGLEPGRYRVALAARGHGARTVDAEVSEAAPASQEVTLPPEARVRLKVVGEEGRRVRVRITRQDRVVPAFLEPPPETVDGALDAFAPTFLVGEEDVVLGGLAAGSYLVEVLHPERATFGARFEAVAGETASVEVRPRAP